MGKDEKYTVLGFFIFLQLQEKDGPHIIEEGQEMTSRYLSTPLDI